MSEVEQGTPEWFAQRCGKATPGAHKLLDILGIKWGFKNLGIYAYRPMRGSTMLSVHGTGRAFDAGYKQSQQELVTEICDWLANNHVALGIEEIHQYVWGTHGRGFRCNRLANLDKQVKDAFGVHGAKLNHNVLSRVTDP